jgi:hypothetical protein
MKYTEETSATGEQYIARDNGDGSFSYIPKDPANADYQEYLNPKAEQSTPIVTDEAKTK